MGSHSLTQHMHKVRGQRSRTWGMVRWPDITQLCTARYRWVDLLLISVASVTVTEQCAWCIWRLMSFAIAVAQWNGRLQPTQNLNQVFASRNQLLSYKKKKLLKKSFLMTPWVNTYTWMVFTFKKSGQTSADDFKIYVVHVKSDWWKCEKCPSIHP